MRVLSCAHPPTHEHMHEHMQGPRPVVAPTAPLADVRAAVERFGVALVVGGDGVCVGVATAANL